MLIFFPVDPQISHFETYPIRLTHSDTKTTSAYNCLLVPYNHQPMMLRSQFGQYVQPFFPFIFQDQSEMQVELEKLHLQGFKEKGFKGQKTVEIKKRLIRTEREKIEDQCHLWERLMAPIGLELREMGEKEVAEMLLTSVRLEKEESKESEVSSDIFCMSSPPGATVKVAKIQTKKRQNIQRNSETREGEKGKQFEQISLGQFLNSCQEKMEEQNEKQFPSFQMFDDY